MRGLCNYIILETKVLIMKIDDSNRRLLIILIAVFLISTVFYIDRCYIYPVHYNLPKLSNSPLGKLHSVLNRLEDNKTTDKKLIFWETPVSLGLTKSELISLHPSTSEIHYNGKSVDVNIIYDCTYEIGNRELKTIYMRIPYDPSIEKELMSYYGNKYIHSRKYKGERKSHFYVWVLDDGYAILENYHPNSLGEKYLYLELGVLEWGWKDKVNYGAYVNLFEDENVYMNDLVPKKDSIDLLIEHRKTEEFNSSIFGGLYFGDSPEEVSWVFEDDDHQKILVPNEDKVAAVNIATYDAEYYKGQLASLILYSEQDELYNNLGTLYKTKYGETKNNDWHFANCSIEINYGFRLEYNPAKDAGYNSSGPTLYHQSFRLQRSSSITKDGSFLKIEYKHHHLLKLIERERQIKDSLDNVQRLKEIEEEKELARKLATQPAVGI